MSDLLDRLIPVVDKTFGALAKTKFRVDPIGGERYSRQTSIISSAYKRHGQILEKAIRERLSESQYFTVWHDAEFSVSNIADRAIQGRNSDIPDSPLIELPYGDPGRKIQIDAFVFDSRINSLRSYEIKRGNGHFDAGKKRSLLRDTLCTQALLRSYGERRGHWPSIVEAKVICYFGIKALPDPLRTTGDDLDDHFVFPVYAQVERVNTYFKEQLYALLQSVGADAEANASELCPDCPRRPANHFH